MDFAIHFVYTILIVWNIHPSLFSKRNSRQINFHQFLDAYLDDIALWNGVYS